MSLTKLNSGDTIGIIGGGQLGRMMAQSAIRMGFRVAILDPDEACPARCVSHTFIHGEYSDAHKLNELGKVSDVITYEFENISGDKLQDIANTYYVPQGAHTVLTTQNRLDEKLAIEASGARVVPFVRVDNEKDLKLAAETLHYPFVVKTTFGGYDGKGQVVVNSASDYTKARELVSHTPCVAEAFIDLNKEISITASRNPQGDVVFFPVQENVHRNHILYKTTVTGDTTFEAQGVAEVRKIMTQLHFVGTFTVEFFIDRDNELYVNEIAPRPHNSCHYSIEACNYSQFDTHILAIAGYTLPQAITLHTPCVMYNLLGQDVNVLEHVFSEHPEWHVHLYGKAERKENRKMGHVTILNLNNDYEATYKENV